ncbi:sterol 3beta-glucosyltransferase [Variovorax sp. TBS-050B]|uniref:glycosyltransferase n=1 Tax=Variovorax sp. TBS-050B TaxID=2940551 RepID=UPI002475284D|nr:glycosyltransferase [Variovorax sp. TBS-050B]MDH6590336.1 sterol 3beta-glucosyltransferase [Variovorax sp. TBS-050B]
MKIAVLTYGTEGDTRPLGALCHALDQAGHASVLLADAATLASTQALGVCTQALAGDIRGALGASGAIANVVAQSERPGAAAKALAAIANTHAAAWLRQTVQTAQGCDAIVCAGLAAFVGLSAGEALGVPVIGAGLFPLTPTRDFATPFIPPARVPRWLNRPSHHLINTLLWRAFRPAVNAARAEVCGLPPRRRLWTTHPMLYGFSPSLVPRPADWPANASVCGQWIPPARAWQAPEALEAFLAAGEAPLYIGFGSMTGFDARRMRQTIVDAAAGRRVVLNPGWSGLDAEGLPPNFHVVGDVPHDWLFPRMALMVHHGGSGTTHSAARAGVPSVVVPFAGDQFFWAHRLAQAGVAPEAVAGSRLDADALARGIAFADRAEVRERAAVLGARMRAEDGLARGVEAIERALAGTSVGRRA